jgi:probable HAF family extracellular repeat protein
MSMLGTLVAILVGVFWPGPASGQCQYEIVAKIEGPDWGYGPAKVFVEGMNSHGHVVGWYRPLIETYPFLWTPEDGLVTLPLLPGYAEGRALAINDRGDIVGRQTLPNGGRNRACLWRDGEAIDLGALPDGKASEALAINSAGTIVGWSYNAEGWYRAVVWEDGVIQNLGDQIGAKESQALDINDRWQIVGLRHDGTWDTYRAFVHYGNDIQILDLLPGTSWGRAEHISDNGYVVGQCFDADAPIWHSFLSASSRLTEITVLPGFDDTDCRSVNSIGQVVGVCDKNGSALTGFIWQHGGVAHLVDLIQDPGGLGVSGGKVCIDDGRIAVDAYSYGEGNPGLILAPIDVPEGDATLDCHVNVDDLFEVLGQWGPCVECTADLNDDGEVDIGDLMLVLQSWGNPGQAP